MASTKHQVGKDGVGDSGLGFRAWYTVSWKLDRNSMVQCRDLKLEDRNKSHRKLEDAVAASTVPTASFQLAGGYCTAC